MVGARRGEGRQPVHRGTGHRPSAPQVSGQVGSPSGSPHSPGTPAALVPPDTPISPDSPGAAGHHGTLNSPGISGHCGTAGTPRLTSGAGGPSGCGSW